MVLFNNTNTFYKVQYNENKLSDCINTDISNEQLYTTTGELKNIFKCLNNKKSSGPDKIPNIALKNIPDCIIRNYCILFNNALNNNYYPHKWKLSKIIPIKKINKNHKSYKNYRPINLVPNISKVFEIIIYNKILEYTQSKKIMPDIQFGFRYNHSTVHAINKLVSDVIMGFNDNNVTGAILIDLERAFDSVWIEGLIYKLEKLGFNINLIYIFYM